MSWVFTAALVGAFTCDVPAWTRAFTNYWRAYPKAEAVDLYKFAHHGILGSEHAVRDSVPVQTWMTREVAGLSQRPEPPAHRAPLIEPLPPDGQFVRVHLRPYLAANGDVGQLVRAFIATANGPRGDTAQFACAERALATLATARDIGPVLALFRVQRRAGFDAVHHSPAFEAAYAPAYRVVHRSRIPATK